MSLRWATMLAFCITALWACGAPDPVKDSGSLNVTTTSGASPSSSTTGSVMNPESTATSTYILVSQLQEPTASTPPMVQMPPSPSSATGGSASHNIGSLKTEVEATISIPTTTPVRALTAAEAPAIQGSTLTAAQITPTALPTNEPTPEPTVPRTTPSPANTLTPTATPSPTPSNNLVAAPTVLPIGTANQTTVSLSAPDHKEPSSPTSTGTTTATPSPSPSVTSTPASTSAHAGTAAPYHTRTPTASATPTATSPATSTPVPDNCRIKGNINVESGERVYHTPNSPWYSRTEIDTSAGERWFCTEVEAREAGWRAPQRVQTRPTSTAVQSASSVVCETTVNINAAGSEELETLPGIGPVKAQAIVDYRNANGNFSSIEELDNVEGIGVKTLEKISPCIVLH